jgi:hypothetical protein
MFLAIGVYLCILGAQCLAVEKVVLKIREQPRAVQNSLLSDPPNPGSKITIVPPAYAPWSLMAFGSVVILYAFDLPRRVKD